MDTHPRPNVSPERYRELEIKAMQHMLQLDHRNLGECLIIHDICRNVLRRWVENERMAQHELASRIGPLLATSEGRIVQLAPAE